MEEMERKEMIYLQLFWAFFKTGLFAIGGGLATLPFLYDISAQYGWFTEEELANMIAIAESTPGPIGVNMATYAGIEAAGIPGGIIATFSLVLPSLIIILLVAFLLGKFQQNSFVQSCMRVLRPTSVGLIGAAVYSVVKVALLNLDAFATGGVIAVFNWLAIALSAVLAVIAWKFKKLHPIVLILIGAAGGILLKL